MFGLDEVKICLGLLCFCFGFGLHTATASFASLPSTPSSFHCPVAQVGRGVWVHFFSGANSPFADTPRQSQDVFFSRVLFKLEFHDIFF